MVNDLLDLAKVEAGRVEISPAWFELVDLFSALRGMFKPVLVNPDVSLVFEEPPDVPPLYTDDQKLSQILRNFISNALKFTQKGEVRVSAHAERRRPRSPSRSPTPASASRRSSTTRSSTTSRRSTRRSRSACAAPASACRSASAWPSCSAARVALQSELGEGSTFSVTLPLRLPQHEPSTHRGSAMDEANDALRPIDRSQHELLVVDDDPASRYATARLLRSAGFPHARGRHRRTKRWQPIDDDDLGDGARRAPARHRRLRAVPDRSARGRRPRACRSST